MNVIKLSDYDKLTVNKTKIYENLGMHINKFWEIYELIEQILTDYYKITGEQRKLPIPIHEIAAFLGFTIKR